MNRIMVGFLIIIASGCGADQAKEQVHEFAGTYVRRTDDSTGSLDDTFYIRHKGDAGGTLYTITQRSGIVNVDDHHNRLPKEMKERIWDAEYSKETNTLNIPVSSEKYVLAGDSITSGSITYQRIR